MVNDHGCRRDSRYPLKQRMVCKMIRKHFDPMTRAQDISSA